MDKIKVSVIVPVYGVEKYLSKCLDSLVNQTLQEIEILVINDGSPDNCQSIIDDYVRRYPNRVRSFVKENGGLSDARNYGLQRAVGEYIAFVDSDDYVDIDMYEKMYNRAIESESDIVCSPVTYAYATRSEKRFFNKTQQKYFGNSALEKPNILKFVDSYAWNKIYSRDLWSRGRYEFPKGQYFEDSSLIYRVFLDARKIEAVNIPFYNYVNNRDDQITKKMDSRIFDIFKSCDSIIDAFNKKEKTPELNNTMVYLCVKHILARIRPLVKQGDSELARKFLKHAYEYLDSKLPEWKQCSLVNGQKKDNLKRKISKFILRNKQFAIIYFCLPVGLRAWFHKIYNAPTKMKNICKSLVAQSKIKQKVVANTNKKKRLAVQTHGLSFIENIQSLLREIGIKSFADFGTLLGIIREGRLLAHDMDVDIGVILNDSSDLDSIRVFMERNKFKLWRQYLLDDNIVEESYTLNGLKVDLNYYRIDDLDSKTWLFYTKPGFIYLKNNERHIVEMSYSRIAEMRTIEINGVNIVIPDNAEQILLEKYGETWQTPDTGWIYWQSPAAKQIDGMGRFITYKYKVM